MHWLILLFHFSFLVFNPWKTTISIEGGFQIEAPGDMVHKINKIPTSIGDIDYHTYLHHLQKDSVHTFLYMVSYCNYPAGSFPADSSELIRDFFDATLEQSAQSVSGEVVYVDQITYRGFPGLFWRMHYNGGRSVMKTKAYLINSRFYSLQVAMESDFSLDPDIDRFFDSFKVITK
jgi:hypothetical protein